MGLNTEALRSEFDPGRRIVHISAAEIVHAGTLTDGYALSEAVQEILKSHLGDKPGFMIVDYTRIIIEPICIAEYATAIKKIIDTYLYPDGIARYGFEIGRVTAQLGHSRYIGTTPNLFANRAEAEAYIDSLIAEMKGDDEPPPVADEPEAYAPIYRHFTGHTKPEY